ncbi:FAD-dependent oxidoreductase [Microbulbifer elongatus]|uniref:FAD-dependent oxidoreductase n=1 Tax=Microbulbifer elongatus TaxID=86173 RepID=A0ABT1P4Y9_9GAMM|nr:FAD-dependent oxidoreductase [Microbulbifer elongatus]MCQ3830194.1 FAD-dependent oxidoreductase [Microbulbifer elongatus]
MHKQAPSQDVVLIGGGHGHLELLRRWAESPAAGVRLTLVSPQTVSAYSPMVPGMIAGLYPHSEIHIDLPRLCRAAGARFIQACAHHIDLERNCVSLLGRADLPFDYLSLAVGATSCHQIPGAEHAIPVKPIGQFYRYWEQLQQQIQREHRPMKLGVVGGGAGGFELAMAMASALEEPVYSGRVEIHLVQADHRIPSGYPLLARRLAARELARLKVRHHTRWQVSEITARGIFSDAGQFIPIDKALLCTEPSAPPWLTQAGLAVDDGGFVQVDKYLRARSHPHIFAAGDVVSGLQPYPKSAAEACNQGSLLYDNLRAALQAEPLTPYRPQRRWSRLLACGPTQAIATCGALAAAGSAFARWKSYLERRFVQRINQLPLPASENISDTTTAAAANATPVENEPSA